MLYVWIGLGVFSFIVLLWLTSTVVVVKQKTAKIIENLGKFNSVKQAGLTFKAPWPFGRVAGERNLQQYQLAENVGVKSKDNAFLTVPVKVLVQVIEEKVKEAFYELNDPNKQIMTFVVNIVRSKANEMTMDEIFSSKNAFGKAVEEGLKATFTKYGFAVNEVLVDDPQPSDQLKVAFDKVLAAARDKEASLLEKDAIRNRVVGQAEAEADSLRLKATAYVDMRMTMANGNSEAIKKFCEGLDISHMDALQYFTGLDTRDAIRDASQGKGSVVVIPVSGMNDSFGATAGLMKSLGNAAETK